jgi:hypothetical protein
MTFQGYTMPPPSGGLDLVTPIDNMEPQTALELTNIFPGAGAPTVRLGYTSFRTGGATIPSTPIRFMHEYPLKDGTAQLIAGTDTSLYSTSSLGVITDITRAAGAYSAGSWNKELFAGNIYLCNGTNEPQVYLGTGLAINITGTGVTGGNTTLAQVTSYRERLYFAQKNTCIMWYHKTVKATLATGSPVMDSYDFQYIFRRGGSLLFIGSYTNNKGVSAQDLFMAVSSEGEVVLYSGTSPDDTAWSLVAHFIIGKPLGRKAFVRVNQDVWIITQQGIIPVSALFETDPEQALNIVSLRINPLITQYATQASSAELWGGFFWPQGRRVYITLPDSASTATLLVYSLDTKAWTQFVLFNGEHAVSSCKFLNLPFYGSNTGIIYQGETGYADAVTSTSSQSIAFSCRTAFSFYGARGNYKAFKDIRPLLRGKRGATLNLGLDTDFKRQAVLTQVTTPAAMFTAWGAKWGSDGAAHTAYVYPGDVPPVAPSPATITVGLYYQPWSGDLEYIYDRYAIAGQGHSAAIRVGGSIKNSSLQFLGFEIRYDLGGQV